MELNDYIFLTFPSDIGANLFISKEDGGGSRKKVLILVARPLRPYPSPFELSGHIFFGASKKVLLISGQVLYHPSPPAPLLVVVIKE